MTLLFLAALALLVVIFVLHPVFDRKTEALVTPSGRTRELRELMEKKERLYEAIKDLDFERQAGKLSEADHQKVRVDYLSQAAAIVARIEELERASRAAAPPVPAEPARAEKVDSEPAASVASVDSPASGPAGTAPPGGPRCQSCHQENPPGARFCYRCGDALNLPTTCPQCSETLPSEARFCTACGVAIPA